MSSMEPIWILLTDDKEETPPSGELLKLIVEILIGDISNPPPSVDSNGSVTLHPKVFINASGGNKILRFLKPDVFFAAPLSLQETTIKAFQAVLSHDTYAVTNFQNGQGLQLVSFLMELITQLVKELRLEQLDSEDSDGKSKLQITKELCNLIGIVGAAGITSHDLKNYMKILASSETPPQLRSYLLSTLPLLAGAPFYGKLVPSWRCRQTKQLPPPAAFFSINGHADINSGLVLPFEQWPFDNEYQITMWIRFERLPVGDSNVFVFALSCGEDGSGLILSADSSGVLSLRVGDSDVISKGGLSSSYRCGGVMVKHWHFLSLTHSKPRGALTMFQKDSLTLSLDHKCVLSVAVPVPKRVSPLDLTVIAQGLQGHVGEIHIFKEKLSDTQVSVLASHSRVRRADACPCDLEAVKGLKLTSNIMLAVYHPQRTLGSQVIDIHHGHHATLRGIAHTYQLAAAQTALDDIGGALLLLPLICSLIGAAPHIEVKGHNIASRFEAIATFLVGQSALQRDMIRARFADMLEFALFHLTPRQLAEEEPSRCVTAIESLVSVSQGQLFDTLVTRVFFNLRLFAFGAPFKLQQCLLKAYRSFVKVHPIAFRKLVGVSRLLGAMSELYRDQFDEVADPSSANKGSGNITNEVVPFKDLQNGGLRRCPRSVADNVITREERSQLRKLLLSVIFESFVSSQAAGVTTDEETRAILQFICNPFPEIPSLLSEVTIITDVSYLLLSLLRRSTPALGLYPSLHVISEHQPTCFAAIIKARILSSGDDEAFAVGIRLLSTYCSRIGANLSSIQGLLQSSSSSLPNAPSVRVRSGSIDTSHSSKLNGRFYSQGLHIIARSLEQHKMWFGDASYASLIELLLNGDEETIGWKADVDEYITDQEDDKLSAIYASNEGDGAQELSALMRRGKHLSPKETARASELIKAGLLLKAASSKNVLEKSAEDIKENQDEEIEEEYSLPISFNPISLDEVFNNASPRSEICSSSCASVLLGLLPLISIEHQEKALSDLLRLLSCIPKNVVTVAHSTAWQNTLFNLVAPHVISVENDESRDRIVNLLSWQTNEHERSIGLHTHSWQESKENRGDICYEYQRWFPLRGWGMTLLPTDPGKWSDEAQTKYGSALCEVAPVLPSGWEVHEAWAPQEWETSILSSFRSTRWSEGVLSGRTVRRRKWMRMIRLREQTPNQFQASTPTLTTKIDETKNPSRNDDVLVCGLARKLLVKVLACCMSLPQAVSPAGTDIELIMALEKKAENGKSVSLFLLSELISEVHLDLLQQRRAANDSWLEALRASSVWPNFVNLCETVSFEVTDGACAVSGIAGVKRAILLSTRIKEVQAKMSPDQLNRCHYKCNEERHTNICYFTVDTCPQCHHAKAAHSLVNHDIFQGLRRRLDEELLLSELPQKSSTGGAAETGEEEEEEEERGHGCRPQSLLAKDLPGVDGWDDGRVLLFTTKSDTELPAAKTPLHSLSRFSADPERKLLVGLQLSHLLDLIMFPQEQIKDRPGVGVIGRLEDDYGVGLTVGRLDDWTPAPPDLVISAIRINLTLLAHCALNDRQLPSICLRLKRFAHYLVWMDSSENESLNDWVTTIFLHVHTKLVMIRSIVYGDKSNQVIDMVKKSKVGEEDFDSTSYASDDASSKDYSGLGFRQQMSDGTRSRNSSIEEIKPSKTDLARSSFWHRAFSHANWVPYSGNESSMIGAALASNPMHGVVSLSSNEEGVSYEIRWNEENGTDMYEINTSLNSPSNGLIRMVKRVNPMRFDNNDVKKPATKEDENEPGEAEERGNKEMNDMGYSEKDEVWKNIQLESMLVSARVLFGILDGFWRVRRELLEPLLQINSARALGRLLAAVRKGEKVAASANARAEHNSRRKKGEPLWEELGADFEVIEPMAEDAIFDDKMYLSDVIKWLTSSFLSSDETSLFGSDAFIEKIGNLHFAETDALKKHKSTLNDIWFKWIDNEKEQEETLNKNVSIIEGESLGILTKLEQREVSTSAAQKVEAEQWFISGAQAWARCSFKLQAKWSPWRESSEEGGLTSKVYWRLSNHEDSQGRRMLLEPNTDYVDLSDKAWHAADKSVQVTIEPKVNPSVAKSAARLRLDPSKMSNDLGDIEEFDNEDDEDEDEEEEEDEFERSIEAFEVINQSAKSPQDMKSAIRSGLSAHRPNEKTIRTLEVQAVRADSVTTGRLVLTSMSLYFHADPSSSLKGFTDQQWDLKDLESVYTRRYLLRPDCAVEIFFAKDSLFIVFKDSSRKHRFWTDLRSLKAHRRFPLCNLPEVTASFTRNASLRTILSRSGLIHEWQTRKISNFEYLMRINKLAGRSRNDLTQYPVFPWVLSDYTSKTLNLDDNSVYRDLTKPVGALNEERLASFVERYECFEDEFVPKFMFGSHYSSAGTVLHFLVRQEPYTSLSVEFQDGHFDCADRLFLSMEGAWKSCNESMTDVKELIPEMFYDPNMFYNSSDLPLGTTQTGEKVGDVILPPWANNNPNEFVRLHRLALESDYVSNNLHHWIDLIFGYKQTGEEAVKANNLFYYLTYEGAVDLDSIEDPLTRDSISAQIKHFGQTPTQLFTSPHPRRDGGSGEIPKTMAKEVFSFKPTELERHDTIPAAAIIYQSARKVLIVSHEHTLETLLWSTINGISAYRSPLKAPKPLASQSIAVLKRGTLHNEKEANANKLSLSGPTSSEVAKDNSGVSNPLASQYQDLLISDSATVNVPNLSYDEIGSGPWCFGSMGGTDRPFVVSVGYWDNSIKVHHIDSGRLYASSSLSTTIGLGGHHSQVNCVAAGCDGSTLVSGGEDGTLRVWMLDRDAAVIALAEETLEAGQFDSLGNYASMFLESAVDISGTSASTVSSSRELGSNMFGEGSLRCARVLWGCDSPVICVAMDCSLDIVAAGCADGTISVHTIIGGKFIWRSDAPVGGGSVNAVTIDSRSGDILAHSWKARSLSLFTINGVLRTSVASFDSHNVIQFTSDGTMLVCAGSKGTISFLSRPNLEIIHEIDVEGPVEALAQSLNGSEIICSTASGKVYSLCDPKAQQEEIRMRLAESGITDMYG